MLIIGHRGAAGLAPENTIAAMEKGMAAGVDALEFDLRQTADAQVVVNHDPFITNSDGKQTVIRTASLAELRTIKNDLATFSEIMDYIHRRSAVRIELKLGEPTKLAIEIIEGYLAAGWPIDMLSVCSFSQQALIECKAALPGVGLIVIEKWSSVRANYRAKKLGTRQICMNQKWLWSFFIRSVSHRGTILSAYTLDDPKKAAHFERYGLSGIVTNYPDRFR